MRALAAMTRAIAGVRIERGLAINSGVRIYFANHSSHLDFVVIWATLPSELRVRVRPVAAEDYWRRGRFRRWLAEEVFRAVLIARGSTKRSDDPLGRMGAVLEDGNDLIVFPEGTRGDGEIAPFRSGLYHLAARFPQAELVPVYLQNLNRILPKGEFLPVPVLGHIAFGPPIAPLGDGEGKACFLTRARTAVLALGPVQSAGASIVKESSPS